jgi:hypothetical protein
VSSDCVSRYGQLLYIQVHFHHSFYILAPTFPKGNDIPTLLTAIMQLLPLDETAPPAIVMEMVSVSIVPPFLYPAKTLSTYSRVATLFSSSHMSEVLLSSFKV